MCVCVCVCVFSFGLPFVPTCAGTCMEDTCVLMVFAFSYIHICVSE